MFREYLEKTSTLWLLLGVSIALIFCIEAIKAYWGFTLIDVLSSPEEVRAVLLQMSTEQRTVHAVSTSTLDVLFPLALGGLLAGIAFRSFKNYGKYLAILPLAVIPVELIEGVIQVLALTETYDALQLKAVITPLKMFLLFGGVMVALIAGIKSLFHKINSTRLQDE